MADDRDANSSRLSHPVVHWLMTDAGGHEATPGFLAELGRRLNDAGVDVGRMTTGVPILHPQVASFSALWVRGGETVEREFVVTPETFSVLADSPINIVYNGGGPVRCDPSAPFEKGEFPILADLRAVGITDYLVLPAPFSDGTVKAVTFATDRAGGFTEADCSLFEALTAPLAMRLEIQTLRRTARILLETYVGRQTGRRVLDGAITRGSGETIAAVIWLSDLRGFTALSETLPRDALIDLLNAYFGAMSEAVQDAGGEILKFIGDAMLAIFPIAADGDIAEKCANALAAARRAGASLRDINARRASEALPEIRYGIALHAGDVMYGNIGGRTRLDFTVIGPAVNQAARIEGLCGTLGRDVLMSEAIAAHAGDAAEAMGAFEFKGIAAPVPVFGLR